MLRSLLASVLLLASLSVCANDIAWAALAQSAKAARHLNYKGIFVYQDATKMHSTEITHVYKHGRELTRSIALDGKPREVYSEDDEVVIYGSRDPNHKKVVVAKRHGRNIFPAVLPKALDNLRATYTAKFVGEELVAGRPANIIDLIPNDVLRYRYRFWTDKELSLLLKMALRDDSGQVLQHMAFTQINLVRMPAHHVQAPKLDANKEYVMEKTIEVHHVNDWVVGNLPPGFNKIDQLRFQPKGKPHHVNQMIFSDGIASVSLFIEQVPKGHPLHTGRKTIGSTNLCANVVDGFQVTVVGEVPYKTVRQIAGSVRLQKVESAPK